MITDIECRSEVGPDLDRAILKPYWSEYFSFASDAPDLHARSENALRAEIDRARVMVSPYLDAQQAVSRILTAFGSTHNFHRQFNERFASRPSQVLGMQLYELVARDDEWWIYFPTQHAGHVFPHATYFIRRADSRYISLMRRNSR
ncbi:hypothetical protein LMG23992_02281 [Cupriavidus laharis]|uniref:Uncharacterized protein n=1 Tax=Cupriavidus laharis TaxID=151654 RepID=A0ABN7YKB5_9BURK|nr:hypothetical protein [Cupriavidus laharis]CAG9172616.1 hypothetical protein LMG23992_02281 [Cupriavidus laharis]